jgi:hypothetical protein
MEFLAAGIYLSCVVCEERNMGSDYMNISLSE